MKLLTFSMQQEIYKRIVDVLKTLASVNSINDINEMELNYAIGDMFYIARAIGGKRMTKALEINPYNKERDSDGEDN